MSSNLKDNTDELFQFVTALEDTAEPLPTPHLEMQQSSHDPDQAKPLEASGMLGGRQEAGTTPASEQASSSLQYQGHPPQAML
ncbi:hypothetical protein LTR35_017778, partial [Friedmanniomyces endolithicus]